MEEFILSADLSDGRIVIFAVDAKDEADIEQVMAKDQVVAKSLQSMTSQRAFACPWCAKGPVMGNQRECPNPACKMDYTTPENQEVLKRTPAVNVPGTIPRSAQCDTEDVVRIKTCNVICWALLETSGQLYALWSSTRKQVLEERKLRAAERAGLTLATSMAQADVLAKQQATVTKGVKEGPSSNLKIVR